MLAAMNGVRELLNGAAVTGGVAAWGGADGEVHSHVFGTVSEGGPAVTAAVRYDLASLTKVVATLPSLLRLVAAGELDLDRPLRDYFSNIGSGQEPSLASATPRQLLSHNAGLPAFSRVHTVTRDRLVALAATLQTPLLEQPGGNALYSDVGFMLLGALIERLSGLRLDRFAEQEVFGPLGMSETHFNPLEGWPRPAVYAATEHCDWRNRLLAGEVHDENAFAWGGVAGHAGLFGSAGDLAVYARAWLEQDERLGPADLLDDARSGHARGADGELRGLGWLLGPARLSAGRPGFGHTGFTGTSLWVNPDSRRWAVLLTNRVHPDRHRETGIAGLRNAFHQLVL